MNSEYYSNQVNKLSIQDVISFLFKDIIDIDNSGEKVVRPESQAAINFLSKVKGEIDNSSSFDKTIRLKPVEHPVGHKDYSYVKYCCPVCELVGEERGLFIGVKNCPVCNVNLKWNKN